MMELKPSTIDDFRTQQYWEHFFKKRGKEAFEWYGDYCELCDILHKYCKPQDNVLLVGCGNSQMSADMYDVGYLQQTNIDISDTVIRQMVDKHKDREGLKFIKMDMLNMTFEDAEFTVVVDKGTLDAVMTDDSLECNQDVDRMFAEISRVLKFSGRYICVTLAQEHILQKVVAYFISIGWPVRVHKVQTSRESERDRDFYMPVFVLVMTKFKTLPDANFKILEIRKEDGSIQRVDSEEKIYSEVKSYQMFGLIRQRVTKRAVKEDQVCLELMSPTSDTPRYTLHIVDSDCKYKLKYAVFIVPQGRENEWLFSSSDGRLQLAETARSQRLAVVTLHRNHEYTDIVSIQDELSSKVLELSPAGLGDAQVPFMSVENDIGLRRVQCKGNNKYYGDWVVEDVTIGGKVLRRLLHLSQPGFIQTEMRLVRSQRKKKGSKQLVAGKLVLDTNYLCLPRHVAVIAGLAFLHDFQKLLAGESDVLVLGDSGCVLSSYLRKTHTQMKITILHPDTESIDLSKSWFGLQEDKLLKCHMTASYDDVITVMAEKGMKKHVIICDVSASHDDVTGFQAPPGDVITETFLQKIDDILHPQGIFMLHVRRPVLDSDTWLPLKSVFQCVLSKQLLDDTSIVVYAVPSRRNPQVSYADKQKLGQSLKRSIELLNTLTQKVHGHDVPSLIHMIENLSVH